MARSSPTTLYARILAFIDANPGATAVEIKYALAPSNDKVGITRDKIGVALVNLFRERRVQSTGRYGARRWWLPGQQIPPSELPSESWLVMLYDEAGDAISTRTFQTTEPQIRVIACDRFRKTPAAVALVVRRI